VTLSLKSIRRAISSVYLYRTFKRTPQLSKWTKSSTRALDNWRIHALVLTSNSTSPTCQTLDVLLFGQITIYTLPNNATEVLALGHHQLLIEEPEIDHQLPLDKGKRATVSTSSLERSCSCTSLASSPPPSPKHTRLEGRL
jgi:hypothetical protein